MCLYFVFLIVYVLYLSLCFVFLFFKQKTAYEMRISDWIQTFALPISVIVANDTKFYEHMPQVWHKPGAKENFEGNKALAEATATRNGTLGGGYFMMAARALGLDCGPMSGVDLAKVIAAVFYGGRLAAQQIGRAAVEGKGGSNR